MTVFRSEARVTGWLLAGTVAAALLSGAAALALAADRPRPVVTLDLGALPPADATVAAVASLAPRVADTPLPLPEAPAPDESAPVIPAADSAPSRSTATAVSLPEPEMPTVAEMHLPEKPVRPKPRPERSEAPKAAEGAEKAEEKPKRKRKDEAEPRQRDVAEAPAEGTVAAGATTTANKAKAAGGMSAAAYAKAVMKKVRSTRKAARGGKGTAVVGFSIGKDGGLAAVELLQSSGDAALDEVALDHIRRAAPFPVPPADAGRSYSFEFVGK